MVHDRSAGPSISHIVLFSIDRLLAFSVALESFH